MIGVYQIINPLGERYIGKSTDVILRFEQHKKSCHNKKLKDSFLKYGIENHIFEIVEECLLNEIDLLEFKIITNFREKYTLFNANDYEANAGRKPKYTVPSKFIRVPEPVLDQVKELSKPFEYKKI